MSAGIGSSPPHDPEERICAFRSWMDGWMEGYSVLSVLILMLSLICGSDADLARAPWWSGSHSDDDT